MRGPLLTAATLIALFFAALLANLRLAGTSPIVWIDMSNDELEVQRCLSADSCTLTGMSTSVPGQAHAVAWLELRALLAWLGIGVDGTHVAMSVLSALAAVLVFHLATQLGGAFAGALAVWIFMHRMDLLLRATALYNSSILPFFGAVFVLACVAVALKPGVVSLTLAALVAAVMANIHLACVLTGASVVWVALTAPRARIRLAVYGGVVFAAATFVIAPPTWRHNLTSLLEHSAGRGLPVTVVAPDDTLMTWMAFAVAAWLLSFAARTPAWLAYRRRVHGAIAVIIPFLAAFLIAPRFGLHPEAKYLLHVRAACAIAAAVPIGIVVTTLLRTQSLRPLSAAAERLAPLLVALLVALPGARGITAGALLADDERMPTIRDVATVARLLRDEQGWDGTRMRERIKTPYGMAFASGLQQALGSGQASGAVAPDPGALALLLVLEREDLPQPLPASWQVVHHSSQAATVLVVTRSRIDWSALLICTQPADGSAQSCEEGHWEAGAVTGIFLPHMPPGGAWRGTLQLWLPLREEAVGFATHVAMPRMPFVCGGRIVSASDGIVQVDAGQRSATIAAAKLGATDAPYLKLEWTVGAPECEPIVYDGLPPFVIEGDAESVRLLDTILNTQEPFLTKEAARGRLP